MGRRRKRVMDTSFNSSAYLNDRTYLQIFLRMKEIALNCFIYRNMPDTVSVRYLEMQLFSNAFCFFFKDDVVEQYLGLGGMFRNGYDVYGNWINYTAISFDGKYKCNLNSADSVIIYNNFTRTPTQDYVQLFAWRAWNILRTADTNISQQKHLKLLKVPEQRRLTTENIIMKLAGNEIYAIAADDLDIDDMTLDFGVPFISDKLWMQYMNIWNDYLTFLGIISHNTDKRERESTIEVIGHMGDTEMERNAFYRSRKEGFEKVNKMFGLDIQVEFNSDIKNFVNNSFMDWGWENEPLYDIREDDN